MKAIEMSDEVRNLLEDVVEDFEVEGCDGCGTIGIPTINKVRATVGYEPLDNEEED